jgi:hypothetical protein
VDRRQAEPRQQEVGLQGATLYTFLDDKGLGDVTGNNEDGFKVAI